MNTATTVKACWYFLAIHECPLCGSGREYRERRYTPKPEDPTDRFEFRWLACPNCYSGEVY